MRDASPTLLFPPSFEVGKIHIRCEIAATGCLIDILAVEDLMSRVAAHAASWSSMIKRRHGVSVVYREHGAGFPPGRPVLEPAVVGFMHLYALACVEGMLKNCGVWDCAVLQDFVASPVFDAHMKFQPSFGGALKNTAGECVHKLV